MMAATSDGKANPENFFIKMGDKKVNFSDPVGNEPNSMIPPHSNFSTRVTTGMNNFPS